MDAETGACRPAYPEDRFLSGFVGVVALRAAFALGLVRRLQAEAMAQDEVAALGPAAPVLLDLLEAEGVLRRRQGRVALTAPFRRVLRDRGDALRTRLDLLSRAARDLLGDPAGPFADPARFMAGSEVFDLFRYDRAETEGAAARRAARPWIDYVTALTEAEAPRLAAGLDLDGVARLLEIGGNSGAFARELLARRPELEVVVMDLPAVCAEGRARGAGHPDEARLRFLPGDARRDPWPSPVEAVLFKSVLHDWPEREARGLLGSAVAALSPGGRVLVCEREPIAAPDGPAPFHLAGDLVFAPFFRGPSAYVAALEALGLEELAIRRPDAALPFFLLSGRKP